jgi:hypothetical protein
VLRQGVQDSGKWIPEEELSVVLVEHTENTNTGTNIKTHGIFVRFPPDGCT